MTVLLALMPLMSCGLEIPTKQIAAGVNMPVVSIGTGGDQRPEGGEIVKNWLAIGGRGIDTASSYGNADKVKGAIEQSGIKREDLFITSKIHSCSDVESSVSKALSMYGMKYFDLLLIHFPKGDCVSAWKTLEGLYKKGTLKAIGVSNFKTNDLEPILKIATVTPHVNQIRTNVLYHDDTTIAYAASNNITIEAWSPLDGKDESKGSVPHNLVVEAVAANHKVSGYQVALKWILQHGHVLTFQSTTQAHQRIDADLFGFTLTDDEMQKLDHVAMSLNAILV